MKITYKRGTWTYEVEGWGETTEKAYFIYVDGKHVGYITYCDTLKEWFAYKDENTNYFCANYTLKELKVTIKRIFETSPSIEKALTRNC